jgi:hypothetical protein
MTTTKNQALSIKRQQQQSALQATLPHNTLHIALWIRNDPPPENDYHWAFYFHQEKNNNNTPGGGGEGGGGMQYQVNSVGSSSSSGYYLPDHQPARAIVKSNFLCVLIQISAGIPEERIQDLDRIMRTYDQSLNSVIPGVTCRVWMFRVLPLLVETGFVKWRSSSSQDDDAAAAAAAAAAADEVDRVAALEDECKGIGNRYRLDAAMNVQPRPVVVSTLYRCEE